jgi:hypothetical protein
MTTLNNFNLQQYLSDPAKLRGANGEVPTFSAYSAASDTLYVEWPANTAVAQWDAAQQVSLVRAGRTLQALRDYQTALRATCRLMAAAQSASYRVAILAAVNGAAFPVLVMEPGAESSVAAGVNFLAWSGERINWVAP